MRLSLSLSDSCFCFLLFFPLNISESKQNSKSPIIPSKKSFRGHSIFDTRPLSYPLSPHHSFDYFVFRTAATLLKDYNNKLEEGGGEGRIIFDFVTFSFLFFFFWGNQGRKYFTCLKKKKILFTICLSKSKSLRIFNKWVTTSHTLQSSLIL